MGHLLLAVIMSSLFNVRNFLFLCLLVNSLGPVLLPRYNIQCDWFGLRLRGGLQEASYDRLVYDLGLKVRLSIHLFILLRITKTPDLTHCRQTIDLFVNLLWKRLRHWNLGARQHSGLLPGSLDWVHPIALR